MNKVVRKKRTRAVGYRVDHETRKRPASPGKRDTHGAGVHRSPAALFSDAIQRALGWESEGELRHLVHNFTGYQLSLDQANLFSQEVAAIVLRQLRRKP